MQGLGQEGRLSSLGFPESCVPRDRSAIQLQPRRLGSLFPLNSSLISAVNGLSPLLLGLFSLIALLLVLGLFTANLALL